MNDLISVVIPVYNVEHYVKQCVDSVLCQTYSNLEVFLVDDGSTDKSKYICDDYRNDIRVKVIHQENKGLSGARNTAIQCSTGKYIMFVDSDDYLATGCIESLYSSLIENEAEISCCGFIKVNDNGDILDNEKYNNTVINRFEAQKELLTSKNSLTTAWGKIYKRELFDSIRYPEGRINEDVYTTYLVFDKVNKISFIDEMLYFYRENCNSITHKPVSLKSLDSIYANEERAKFIKAKYPDLIDYAYSTIAHSATKLYYRCLNTDVDIDIKRTVREYVRKYLWYMEKKSDCSIKTKVFSFLVAYMPLMLDILFYGAGAKNND